LIATLLGESSEADITKTQTETFVEGYDQVGIDATKYKVSEDSSSAKESGISTVVDAMLDKPLREFVIKSSYNTAVSGNFVTLDMVKYVIGRGCRFLDFELFYNSNTNDVFVAYSMDSTYRTIQGDSSLSLVSVFTRVMGSAFNADSPNPNDPLFIQLRVKTTSNKIFPAIADDINKVLKPKLYQGTINNKTTLNELMGKVIIVMDKTINQNYYTDNGCVNDGTQCEDIKKYITITDYIFLHMMKKNY
jgi:hypothetical protein